MSWPALGMLVTGMVLLTMAADRLVLAAARLSRYWGMSPILVGALVIGMGTSAPELLVSGLAGLGGQTDLAIGNVVGSNVANVTLVLGATALIRPIPKTQQILVREGALMLVAVATLTAVIYDLRLDRLEGVLLVGGMVLAAWLLIRWARHDAARMPLVFANKHPRQPGGIRWPRELAIAVVCLAATVGGAQLLVSGATTLAEALGLASAFVGMTIVAIGTSLPELATAIAGARRNENEIIVGNVVGSNLFNALAVAGVAGILGPGHVDPSFVPTSVVMVGAAALAGVFAATGGRLSRSEGLVLLTAFAGFIWLSY